MHDKNPIRPLTLSSTAALHRIGLFRANWPLTCCVTGFIAATAISAAAEPDRYSGSPVVAAPHFDPTGSGLGSGDVKISLSDRDADRVRAQTAKDQSLNSQSERSGRLPELVKRPVAKRPVNQPPRQRAGESSVEIAVHQPPLMTPQVGVAEAPFMTPHSVNPPATSSPVVPDFEVVAKSNPQQVSAPTSVQSGARLPSTELAAPALTPAPVQPNVPMDVSEPTFATATPTQASPQAIAQPEIAPQPVLSNSEVETATQIANDVQSSSCIAAKELEIQSRKMLTQTFTTAIVKATSQDDGVCKVFLIDPLNVAYLGAKDGRTNIKLEFADQTSVMQAICVANAATKTTTQKDHEKIGQVESAIRDLYPNSKIRISRTEQGYIAVDGNVDSESDAREVMILVRQMFLVPTIDRLKVGSR